LLGSVWLCSDYEYKYYCCHWRPLDTAYFFLYLTAFLDGRRLEHF
jgi:hypothetical protein